MAVFIDTHCHLYDEAFALDREKVIAEAKAKGVEKICLPNIDAKSFPNLLALWQSEPTYFVPMLGLHPTELPPAEELEEVLQQMEQDLQRNSYLKAIGEVGIDLYWDTTRKEEQMAVFKRQIQWSVQHQLPLIIHSRNAHQELIQVLSPYKAQLKGGIFHCFGGTAEEAIELLSFPNFFLGIGGVVTFKKSVLPEVLSEVVPLERIVLETDAPYLAPTPYRGKRNEPAFLPLIAQTLGQVYGKSLEEIATITTQNAKQVFSLD